MQFRSLKLNETNSMLYASDCLWTLENCQWIFCHQGCLHQISELIGRSYSSVTVWYPISLYLLFNMFNKSNVEIMADLNYLQVTPESTLVSLFDIRFLCIYYLVCLKNQMSKLWQIWIISKSQLSLAPKHVKAKTVLSGFHVWNLNILAHATFLIFK